jgi:hypothetical protein
MDEMILFKAFFDGSDQNTEIAFSKGELNILEKFLQQARYIESTSLVQMGMPISCKIHFEQDKNTSVSVTLPDWELVETYLHRLRPIILQDEETNFFKICKLLKRRIELPRIRKAVDEEIELYQGANINSTVRLSINDELITCERVLQDYLNGFEFHRDNERRGKIDRLIQFLPLEYLRAYWFWLLQEKGGAILRIAECVRIIIDAYKKTESPKIRTHLLAFNLKG